MPFHSSLFSFFLTSVLLYFSPPPFSTFSKSTHLPSPPHLHYFYHHPAFLCPFLSTLSPHSSTSLSHDPLPPPLPFPPYPTPFIPTSSIPLSILSLFPSLSLSISVSLHFLKPGPESSLTFGNFTVLEISVAPWT